jgi:hypothetical protein
MALAQNPGIVTNGLVFYYDMNNRQKSWIGKPVTNQFAAPTPYNSSGDVSFAINGTGTFRRVYEGTYGGYTIQPNDIVYRYNLSTTGGCHYHGNSASIGSGQYATFIFDYYISQDANNYPSTNFLANFENYGGGALGGSVAAANSYKGIWQTATFTSGPTGSSGTQAMFLYPGACGGDLATSGYVLFKNPQVIFSSSSNDIAPFVNGTRSNTQALVDLTNNNTITAQSLTYASNGTFSFNGSSNYLSWGSTSMSNFTSGVTLEAWVNMNASGTQWTRIFDFGAGQNIDNLLLCQYSTTNDLVFYIIVGSTQYNLIASSAITNNQTSHFVATANGSNWFIYKNGIQVATQASSVLPANVTRNSNYIGKSNWADPYLNGSVYNAKIYNRALSPSEVTQNFAAQRGIYGV